MVSIFGFGTFARELFDKYDICAEDIKVIVDKNPQDLTLYRKNPWLDPEDVPTVFKEGLIMGDNEIKIPAVSWETYFNYESDYKADYAVVGSDLYEDEIICKLLENDSYSRNNIIPIKQWVSAFPLISGGAKETLKLSSYMKKAEKIESCLLIDTVLLSDREAVLNRLPRNMTVAEIGVAFGDFSKKILQETKPKAFYALDVFDENTTGFWGFDIFKEESTTHLKWYKNRFKSEIDSGILKTVKGISWENLSHFPQNFFDYVYLDAGHDYESVKKDVEQLIRVVKPGGIIQFNDYIMYDYMGNELYGVMPVVNSLINETKSKVLFYCLSLGGFDDIVIQLNKKDAND